MARQAFLCHKFIQDWKDEAFTVLTRAYPQLTRDQIDEKLNEMIEKRLVNPKATIHNNYAHKKMVTNLLSVVDWIDQYKPILGGFGCFYKNQNQEINPFGMMLDKFLTLRKEIKGLLKIYPDTSEEYADADRGQLNEKVNANAGYGCLGAPTSQYFNLYTAQSITATGQSLISTTNSTFEYFLSNNNPFFDMNDCLQFLSNVLKDQKTMDGSFLEYQDLDKVTDYICGLFFNKRDCNREIIYKLLSGCTQDELNRIYYKNNLYEFVKLKPIDKIIKYIFNNVSIFQDPNKVPKEIQQPLQELWMYLDEFVAYRSFAFDRIERLKTKERHTVTTIDTDSNMLCLLKWIEYCDENIIPYTKAQDNDLDETIFIAVNVMAYIVTQLVTELLKIYTDRANILPEYAHRINMKNEFLFSLQLLADVKKRYITLVLLREGKMMENPKPDVKGFDFVKSSTSEETKEIFMQFIDKHILKPKEINIAGLMRDLIGFENDIKASLLRGEKKYLTPFQSKDPSAYADPYRQQQVLACIAWDVMYPELEIQHPDACFIVKVKMEKLSDIEGLKEKEPEIYNRLVRYIYNSDVEKLRKKGVYVVAIPSVIDTVPEWLREYMDVSSMTNKILNKIYPLLKSLGIKVGKNSKRAYKSNMIQF